MIELEVVIRTVASFGLLLIAERILGKQTISQMTIFDFIAAITLGAIAGGLTQCFNKTAQYGNFV